MANESIRAAFERMWNHVIAKLGTKADASTVDTISSQIDIMDSVNSIQDTRINEVKQGLETKASVADAAPCNLLDNSNFAHVINQRGLSSYSGAAQYTIDRWKAVSSALTVTVGSNTVQITNTSDTASVGFTQYLESEKTPKVGTKVTIAVGDKNGAITCGSAEMPESGYATVATSALGLALRIVAATDTENARVSLVAPVGYDGYISWVALYEGEYTVENLPKYKPKGYATELAECQRFYQIIRHATGYTASSLANIFIRTAMRETPTVTVSSLGTIISNGATYTPEAFSTITKTVPHDYRIQLSGSFPNYHAAALYNAKIELSADL